MVLAALALEVVNFLHLGDRGVVLSDCGPLDRFSQTLVIRLIGRAVMGLTLQVLKELWAQALLAAVEVEDNFAAWLNVQLGMVMEPPPLLTHAPAVAPQAPATMPQPHPTRPIDVLIVLLLGYNIRLGWGGEARMR